MKYTDKLKDPRWQKKRLKILERDGWSCQRCGDTDNTLHVHHRRYLYAVEPWDYGDSLLVTMCAKCHEEERELWQDISHDFIEILKSKFFADEVQDIFFGFHNLEIINNTSVTASSIGFALQDRNLMEFLSETYLKDLKNRKKI